MYVKPTKGRWSPLKVLGGGNCCSSWVFGSISSNIDVSVSLTRSGTIGATAEGFLVLNLLQPSYFKV